MICERCLKFITNVDTFSKRCGKVNKMFAELFYDQINNAECDLIALRTRYGLDTDEVICY